MAAAESAHKSAVHVEDDVPDAYVRASPGPARDTLPDSGRSATDLTERSRRLIAERWGKVIAEPEPQPAADVGDSQIRLADALNQLHLYRDPTPSLKAVWLDLVEGGAQVHEDHGLMLAGLYWAAGLPGYAIVAACKVTETVCGRPGRMYGALVVALVAWAALAVAGLNPINLF